MSRFVVEPAPGVDSFVSQAHTALATLAAQRGYRSGRLGRAVDDPRRWCLITEWASVGAYRRALSCYDVKLHATPLLAQSLDEPSAYEALAAAEPGGAVQIAVSDLASQEVPS